MAVIGEVAQWLALLFAVWAAVAGALGGATGRETLAASGARGLVASMIAGAVAVAGVVAVLLWRDYEFAYAAATTSHTLPAAYAVAALWSSPPGAALLLAVVVAGVGAVVGAGARARTTPWVVALHGAILVACLAPVVFGNALFARVPGVAAEGAGLAAHLQVPYFLLHAPLAALSYALLLPHQLSSLAVLVVRGETAAPARLARRVAVLGWLLLGVAMLVALAWVYRDVRWWDDWPTRVLVDGSLVAWAAAGAGLLAATPRTRGVLAVLSLAACALAACVSPLGLLERVDLPLRDGRGVAIAAAVLGLAAVAWNAASAVTPAVTPPLASAWRRRAGTGLFALGVVAAVVAIAGQRSARSAELRLETGRATELVDPRDGAWRLVGQGASSYQSPHRDVSAVAVLTSREGGAPAVVTAERWQALDRRGRVLGEPAGTAAVRRTPLMDLRIALEVGSDAYADVLVRLEPFATLLWVGGVLMLLGGALGLFD